MFGLNTGVCLRNTVAALCVTAVSFGAMMNKTSAAEPEMVIKVAHAASTTNTGHKALEYFDKEIRARTDGRIGLEIFPNGQLGGEREQIESIQLGNLDMTFVLSLYSFSTT